MKEPAEPTRLEAWLIDPSVALVVMDRRYRVLLWDDAATNLLGRNAEEATGQRLDQLMSPEPASFRRLLADGSVSSTTPISLRALNETGAPVELWAFARPINWGRSRAVAVALGAKTDPAVEAVLRPAGPVDLVERVLAERIARAEAQHALRSLGRLQAVAATLSHAVSIKAGVDQVVKEATAATGADAVSVYRWEPDTQRLSLLANQGSPPDICARFASIGIEDPMPPSEAFRTNEAVWVPSLRDRRVRFPVLDVFGSEARRAVAALPLVAGGQRLGALALGYGLERTFSPAERSYLQAFADLCAHALARAQLYDAERAARARAERSARQAEALREILDAAVETDDPDRLFGGLLERLRGALGADRTVLYSAIDEPAGLVLRAAQEAPGSVPTPKWVPLTGSTPVADAKELRPWRVDEAATVPVLGAGTEGWAGSIVAAPLFAGDRLRGVVVAGAVRSHHFDSDAAELLAVAARRMAVALDRVAAFEEERRSRRRLELLLDASQLISSSLPRWEVIDRLARLAVPVAADSCVIALPRTSALHRVAIAHADPMTDARCRPMIGQWPIPFDGPSPLAEAFRTGASVAAESLTAAVIRGWADDPEQAAFAETLGLESCVAVPLHSRGSVIGVAGFGWESPRREPFDDHSWELAADVAGFIAIAVHQALDAVRERDLEAAFGPTGSDGSSGAPGPRKAITRLLLVEQFPVVRNGIRLLVERAPDIEVCGEASSLTAAEGGEWDPDIVVHELMLPDCSGPEVVSRLTARFPRARLLALTRMDQPTYVHLALASGVKGYLLKESASSELVDVIRRIAAGEEYVQPSLGSALAHWQAIPKRHAGSARTALTRREQEVLELVALGHTNAEIAEALRVSLRTVETHRSHLAQKLGVRSRAALVTRARELGAAAAVDLREDRSGNLDVGAARRR